MACYHFVSACFRCVATSFCCVADCFRCFVLISLCCGLFPLCCSLFLRVAACFRCVVLISLCLANFVVLWLVSVVLWRFCYVVENLLCCALQGHHHFGTRNQSKTISAKQSILNCFSLVHPLTCSCYFPFFLSFFSLTFTLRPPLPLQYPHLDLLWTSSTIY